VFYVYELNFVTDLMEEHLIKGKLRWLANFREIRRNYPLGEFTIPLYAAGGLEEKGFFLSRVFSTLVTPKYKIHFLFYTSPKINIKLLRKLIIECKNKFRGDDWIFLGLVQSEPVEKAVKVAIEEVADNRVGVTAYSLASRETATSKNVLGKALQKQLKLTEAKFEAFDLPSYIKSFAIVFFLGTLVLIAITLFGNISAAQPLTLLIVGIISLVVGHQVYKTYYRTTLTLNNKRFEIREGKNVTQDKWSNFDDVTIYITPKNETCLRLYSRKKTLDLPISRTGISRKEVYDAIRQLINKK
jgi:xanthosine utilization system XapX-like protein